MPIPTALIDNPTFAAMAGAMLIGAALFALRQAPIKLGQAMREAFTTTLIVDSDDRAYQHVSVWLSRSSAARSARRLIIAEAYDQDTGRWGQTMTLGHGWHLVWMEGRALIIHRHVQEADALGKAFGGGKHQRLTLITLGRDQTPLRAVIARAENEYRGRDLVEVLAWHGGYDLTDRRIARPMETIYIPQEQKTGLIDDLQRFVGARDLYRQRGVPWRRGYLLEGPPGTGKTSLIQALAGLIDRSIYVVNLASLNGDSDLVRAVNQVGWDGVLVLEDIDAIKVSQDRQIAADLPGAPVKEAQRGVTLSGLLNAIDGLTAREGRILFMTSNHPDTLDPALIRPGRIDRREHIGLLQRPEAEAMWRAFQPDADPLTFEMDIASRLPMSAATLQGLLLNPSKGV